MTRERVILSLTGPTARVRAETLERARRREFTAFAAASFEGIRPRADETWFRLGRRGFSPSASSGPVGLVPLCTVRTPRDLAESLQLARRAGAVAIRWAGARVIPLESALAERPVGASIWVVVRDPPELPAALGALEVGADRVVVETDRPDSLDAIEGFLEEVGRPALPWTSALVTRVRSAGVSERVLIDTTSILRASEGLLLGSSAGLLFHVASEAEGSAFSRPRPFRVNAGSPHLYALMADGTTRYLSELDAGDRILATVPGESGRAVRIGRLKVERRPMVLVGARRGGRESTIFLQEAETVRLSGPSRRSPVTNLQVGMRLRVVALPPARHLGNLVHESIEER